MTVALQQSSHLRLYPRARLPGIYRLMQLPNTDTALTFALARQVAHRDHVRFVLGVEIARADDRYRIVARLADVPGVTLHVLQQGAARADWPAGVGVLSGSTDSLELATALTSLDLVVAVDLAPVHADRVLLGAAHGHRDGVGRERGRAHEALAVVVRAAVAHLLLEAVLHSPAQ